MFFEMTGSTQWDDIKPVLLGIALVMVIVLCLLGAVRAGNGIGSWDCTSTYGVIHCVPCFYMFRVQTTLYSVAFLLASSTVLCLIPHFTCLFASCGFGVRSKASSFAGLARRCHSISMPFIYEELRKLFNAIALSAKFCLNSVRHGFYSFKSSCLELAMGYNPYAGSFNVSSELDLSTIKGRFL